MKEKFPACWFYWRDWLDYKVQRMSDAAQGVYMRLLAHIWTGTATQCSIEDNDNALARALGLTIGTWMRRRAEIQWAGDPLLIEEGGMLISKRLRKEVEKLKSRQKSGGDSAAKRVSDKDVLACVDILLENIKGCVEKKLPFLEGKKLENWRRKSALAIVRLHKLDGVSFDDIRAALKFIKEDKQRGKWNGWQAVILSGDKLREHWPKIIIQMERGNGEEKVEWPGHLK